MRKPKHKCFWSQKTEAQVLLGSENRSTRVSGVGKPKVRRALGSILGSVQEGPGVTLGAQRGVREGHRRPPAAEKKNSFPEI